MDKGVARVVGVAADKVRRIRQEVDVAPVGRDADFLRVGVADDSPGAGGDQLQRAGRRVVGVDVGQPVGVRRVVGAIGREDDSRSVSGNSRRDRDDAAFLIGIGYPHGETAFAVMQEHVVQ